MGRTLRSPAADRCRQADRGCDRRTRHRRIGRGPRVPARRSSDRSAEARGRLPDPGSERHSAPTGSRGLRVRSVLGDRRHDRRSPSRHRHDDRRPLLGDERQEGRDLHEGQRLPRDQRADRAPDRRGCPRSRTAGRRHLDELRRGEEPHAVRLGRAPGPRHRVAGPAEVGSRGRWSRNRCRGDRRRGHPGLWRIPRSARSGAPDRGSGRDHHGHDRRRSAGCGDGPLRDRGRSRSRLPHGLRLPDCIQPARRIGADLAWRRRRALDRLVARPLFRGRGAGRSNGPRPAPLRDVMADGQRRSWLAEDG